MDDLRKRAEAMIQEQAEDLTHLSPEETQRLIHELRVHQIELELQNGELCRAQEEIQVSCNRYADLYEFAPVGYLTANKDGLVVEANLTCAAMFGMERTYLLGLSSMAHLIVKEDQDIYYLHRQKILNTKTPQSCEIRIRRKDGSQFDAHLECSLVLDDEENVAQIRIAMTDITERKQAEKQLKTALEEKEVLLKEVYHRVKNNFIAVFSLLQLQARIADNPRTREVLEESMNRVRSMSLIHERLYRSESLAEIDFGESMYTIAAELFHTYNAAAAGILLNVKADKVLLPADKAITCALLLNELVSNALKYAFPEGRSGVIRLELHEQDDHLTFVVSDNGVGIPEDLDIQRVETLGLDLTMSFTDQLEGTLELDRTGGTTFTITFPKEIS